MVGKWQVVLSRQAVKDAKKLSRSGLQAQAQKLLDILSEDPYRKYPAYETLVGNLKGYYSRRINIQHRLVYAIDDQQKLVHVLRMWTHYE
jgi:Txe/YoeB family toxin of toxin-antitoxin system